MHRTFTEIKIGCYLAKPKPARNVDILQWCKEQGSSLPLMAEGVQKYFCITASSTASERIFSASGNIVNAKRHNLDPKTTQMLTFCHQNWREIKCCDWGVDKEMQEELASVLPAGQNIPSQVDLAGAEGSGTSGPPSCLYYKRIMIVIDAPCVMSK